MNIANGVEMLQISDSFMGNPRTIYPTLVYDENTVVLVDTGFPGQLDLFREAMEGAGVAFERINKIILTHHDIDHIGNLSGIVKMLSGRVGVLCHEEEAAYVRGDKTPVKLAQVLANPDSVPPERRAFMEKMRVGFEKAYAPVDETLVHEQELPYCGGITVVYTPGHTPGHLCLYLKQSKTLVTGDLLTIKDGKLVQSDPHIHFDKDQSAASVKRLTKYDVDTVICYHGGLYRDHARERIEELARL